MLARIKLVAGLFMLTALFATQANAQSMAGISPTINQSAYQALQTALQSNGTGSEVVDEAAVAAARAAGLTDAQIAGAMQESGRSVEQQVAALLPSNPTPQQANAAANAVVNATNATGTIVGAGTNTNVAQLSAALQNAGVPPLAANNAATNVQVQTGGSNIAGFGSGGGGSAASLNQLPTLNLPSLNSRLNNLPPSAAGTTPTFTPTTSTLGGTNVGSGPNIAVAASFNSVPVVQVNAIVPAGPAGGVPTPQIPVIPPFLGNSLHAL